METKDAIRGRRSIRKYKDQKIPREILESVLDEARWSPSWGNTQPWEVYVMTGKVLEEFRQENVRLMKAGSFPGLDVQMPVTWPDELKKRYGEMGEVVLTTMNIRRDDKEARDRQSEFMTALFGAPCLLVLCIPADHSSVPYAMLDIGLLTQTICLAAHDRGLGTCIMAMAVVQPEMLRKIAQIPEDRKIAVGIAMGYPDPEFPLNSFERKRAGVKDFVKWVE